MAEARERLLGVDLGAGSLKATVIDRHGSLLGEASAPIETASPRPGWSEQDPESWVAAFHQAVPQALERAGAAAEDLAALCISAGAHTQVLLDREDRVIRPAILWSDQRAAAESDALHARAGQRIIEVGYNRVNPTWTIAQLYWLQSHEPEAVARTARLFLAKDYLRFRITGDWHTDLSDGVGALMADPAQGTWSEELCDLIDWPLERLPPIIGASDIAGRVTAEAAARSGLKEGTPVVTGSNDTTVEIFGAGVITPGQGAIKLATAGVVYQVAEGPKVAPPVSCYPHIIEGLTYTATGTNACASAHRWLRDEFFAPNAAFSGGQLFADMDKMAALVPAGSEGLLYHPFMLGERAPYWDPRLKAHFLGLSFRHGRQHFARALYEGVAFSIRDLMAAAGTPADSFSEIRIIGGGARSALWRQIVADVLGVEIARPANGEASYGAALIAGLGVGLFETPEQAAAIGGRALDASRPDPANHALYTTLFEIYKDAQARLVEIDHRLSELFG
ncbi:MAG: xylulokinase [Pseudomonadota bacterium]